MMTRTIDTDVEDQNVSPVLGQYNEGNDDFVNEITENLRKGRSHWSNWRRDAKEDYDFYSGVQWTEQDAEKLKNEGRPVVVFNRVVRTVNAVIGVEVQNRQEVKYYPRKILESEDQQSQQPAQQSMQQQGQPPQRKSTSDSGFADSMNQASSWVREQCNAEDEESEAFQDTLTCGIGWTEMRMDYDEDPQGMIRKDRIDPLMMLVDPDAKKRNFEDAKWVACIREYTKKEAQAMFPDLQDLEQGTFWNDQDMLIHDQQDEWKYINDYSDQLTKVGKIMVAQYQYWRKEPVYLVLTPDGNIATFSSKKYGKLKKFIEQMAIKTVKIEKKVYKECFLVGKQIAHPRELGCDHFTFRAITGLRDRNRNTYFGLVQLMKDPQRWANKWLSQIQYILNSNAKGGILVEEGAVENMRDLEDDWASPDSVIKLLPGGLNKIKPKESATYPDGIDRLLNYAIGAINDIPGVNLELIGMANRDQPIGLELTRKDAGITVLATFFDSLRRYRKVDGRVLAYFIREYIADGRLIRILGEQGMDYIPLIKSRLAFQYDIIVDDAPTSPNSKDKTFYMLQQIIPMALQAGIPVPKEVIDYAPIPFDLAQKWKQQIADAEAASQPDPQQQQIQQQMQQITMLLAQLQTVQAKADIEKTQSEVAKNYAAAEKDHSVGQEQSALAMQKFGMTSNDQQVKVAGMQADQNRKNLEMALNQYRKLLEVQLDAQLRSQKTLPIPSLAQLQ